MKNNERPADKFKVKGINELFGEDFTNSEDEVLGSENTSSSEPTEVEIELLQSFKNHPFKVIDDEQISIYLMNSKAPCFIRDDRNEYVYLILPVNFNNY